MCEQRLMRPLLAIGLWVATCCVAGADEAAVTVLADFEDASVAAQITSAGNVLVGDCKAERATIPARGQGSLALEIGATARDTSVACDLTFREPVRFRQADRVGTYCWINEGEIAVGFRIHDAHDQLFETPTQAVQSTRRWVHVAAGLTPDGLQRVRGDGPLTFPIELEGFRVVTNRLGKQTVFLDDLQVEGRVRPQDLVRGVFEFDAPTRMYEPGASVAAGVVLENCSRTKALSVSVDLSWMRPDGSVLQTQRADVSLPASGTDFRSHRRLDFSQRIREPGLYRLVAQVRATGWSTPKTLEAAIAVTPSNRRVARGRSTFFALRSNLLREPDLDQMLEIEVARDLGANLLALVTPWRQIEPKPSTFDFRTIESVINVLTRADTDMAVMLVVAEPPDWLARDTTPRPQRVAALLTALCKRFGERLTRFQIDADALDRPSTAAQLEAVREIRARVAEIQPNVQLLPPPSVLDEADAEFDIAAYVKQNPDAPIVFQTEGDSLLSLDLLESYRRQVALTWRPNHWWSHLATPLVGAGHLANAEAVLRFHVQAAISGAGSVLWFDLRDDDNDPTRREALRGLVRRDFSPKTSLLGYATAAGLLTGYRYAGAVVGAPDSITSALFIGGTQQVAVLLPRPNRVLPAVLAPAMGTLGDVSVLDFERRTYPLLGTAAPSLLTTIPRPLFVTLALKATVSEPRISLPRPWLRVPGTVFCGTDTVFRVDVDVTRTLENSYLQARPPKNAPFGVSFTSMALRGEVGDTLTADIRLTPKADQDFERAELPLRVVIEGDTLDVPLEVRPLTDVRPLAAGESIRAAAYRVAQLAPPPKQRTTAKAVLHCAYEAGALHVALLVEDNRVIPYHVDATGSESGDELRLGMALEGNDQHAEVHLDPTGNPLALEPTQGTSRAAVAGWKCELTGGTQGGSRTYRFTIPVRAFGRDKLAAGDRVLLAVEYQSDDGDGLPRVPVQWGVGLGGSRSTRNYRWLVLTKGDG